MIMESVFNSTLDSKLFAEPDIKCRTVDYQNYCLGKGQKDFIHVIVYMLCGRQQEAKQHLSQQILAGLIKLDISACSLTVDIRELDSSTYSKHETSWPQL